MKSLFLVCLIVAMTACGAPFTAESFTDSGSAGAIGAPAAPSAGAAGAEPREDAGGATSIPLESAGAAGAAGAPDLGSAGAPSVDPPPLYTPPPCSTDQNVTGGYDGSLSAAPACLRTKEALNTVACANWDGRSITVNGAAATCGVPLSFPESVDGFTYIDLGPGTSSGVALRWFLTAPAPNPCDARWWTQGDLYAPNEIMLDVCDAPGSEKSCELGKTYAFSCLDTPTSRCTSTGPGASGWTSSWALVTLCK